MPTVHLIVMANMTMCGRDCSPRMAATISSIVFAKAKHRCPKCLSAQRARPTERARRAHHAVRLYRQGIRLFRLDGPDGMTFVVQMIDVSTGDAVGHRINRKTVQVVKLYELWPNIR